MMIFLVVKHYIKNSVKIKKKVSKKFLYSSNKTNCIMISAPLNRWESELFCWLISFNSFEKLKDFWLMLSVSKPTHYVSRTTVWSFLALSKLRLPSAIIIRCLIEGGSGSRFVLKIFRLYLFRYESLTQKKSS